MIHAKEINAVAAKHKLKDTQIEKDYILSWVLYGIASNELLSTALVFKGGTVLKKTYFPDYRFSEVLDFALINEEISNEEILQELEKVFDFVKEEANITLRLGESNTHFSGSIAFYINYIGPLLGTLNSRNIKIDITRCETMEYSLEHRSVFILYSDLPKQSFQLQCYSLNEVLIEKMAALMGRTEPRDLFDFWYLTEYEGMDTRYHKPEFERKAKNKKHDPDLFESKVLGKEKNLKQGWEKKLINQVYELPDFNDVFRRSKRHFKL